MLKVVKKTQVKFLDYALRHTDVKYFLKNAVEGEQEERKEDWAGNT